MTLSAIALHHDPALWSVLGGLCVLLFLSGVAILALMHRQKRRAGMAAALAALLLSYGLFQCIATVVNEIERSTDAAQTVEHFARSLPDELLLGLCAALAVGEALLFGSTVIHGRRRITLMSIKEATDNLPMGVLFYAPNGRILLVNRTMERVCEMLTGDILTDGVRFAEILHRGEFAPHCRMVDDEDAPVIRITDGGVWTVYEEELPYRSGHVHAIMAANITEAYRKTMELRKMQKQVAALNAELVRANREIVALTTERELLAAKVKIHDELGQNLLFLRRLIRSGVGTDPEKTEIAERLRTNIDFLRDEADAVADEYELMIGTAERLGVEVVVTGRLPQAKQLRQVIAAGIHECFTNTLRHAHGNRLCLRITEDERQVTAAFTNNGQQPTGEIREKGGLRLLRAMVERAGGTMEIATDPVLSVTFTLPKEDEHGIPGIDRGRSDHVETTV